MLNDAKRCKRSFIIIYHISQSFLCEEAKFDEHTSS